MLDGIYEMSSSFCDFRIRNMNNKNLSKNLEQLCCDINSVSEDESYFQKEFIRRFKDRKNFIKIKNNK